jgi:hypothetical protein
MVYQMQPKTEDTVLVLALIATLALMAWNHHVHTHDLTPEQQTKLTQLTENLQILTPGDLVTIASPGHYVNEQGVIVYVVVAETRMVTRLQTHVGAWLSGPGPMSRQEPGRFINFATTSAVRELIDANTVVHHREDPAWKELTTWYYIHHIMKQDSRNG